MKPQLPKPFNLNRAEVVDQNFVRFVQGWADARSHNPRDPKEPIRPGEPLTGCDLIELFESQMIARHQDIEARNMRARNEGFHTIGSAGHEGNAVIGRITRVTDPAFLHYRSGAFMAERARKVPGFDSIRDTMLSIAASALDPIAGGRHKVWGSAELNVPPQTSTIASHLPKAVGTAFFLRRAARVHRSNGVMEWWSNVSETASRHYLTTPSLQHSFTPVLQHSLAPPEDAIVICSFGDASVNHAAAQTAFNAAAWTAHQGLPVPILFVCEDNGIGISVPTPKDWIESSMGERHGLKYFRANGLDLVGAYRVTAEAVEWCRSTRAPVFLHLKVVRLLGHAGTDSEHGYRTWDEIEAAEAEDPLLHTARLALTEGAMSTDAVLGMYESVRRRVQDTAREAAKSPRLASAVEVMAPLAPLHRDSVVKEAGDIPSPDQRIQVFRGEAKLPENSPPRHMAALINEGLKDLLIKYPEAVLFGEDAAKKGGVYAVTTGLAQEFGAGRVFDTLLDETMILGMAIGAGQLGMLPIPEIQYLAYYHNAEDQIRGEACSQQFFSNGQFRNPMVVRIQGWSYQKGFGGHFHNDNSIAALRDVPGLIIATPSRGDDAVKMMRTLMALAKVDGRVCVMIEPIALYMTKDLHELKDGAWQFKYPPPGEFIPLGEAEVYDMFVHKEIPDLTILTFANGLYMSLRAAKTLFDQHQVEVRVVDLRWLSPLNEELIVEQSRMAGKVLVVDESRRTGGLAEAILAIIHERCPEVRATRLNAPDTYVPLGPAMDSVLPVEHDIVDTALRDIGRGYP